MSRLRFHIAYRYSPNLLHIFFDHCTEYDADVVFDKNAFFFMKPTYIQVLIKKECLKLKLARFFLFKVEGLFSILMYCMFRYSYNKIKNAGIDWQLFSKTLAGKELIVLFNIPSCILYYISYWLQNGFSFILLLSSFLSPLISLQRSSSVRMDSL